MKKSTLADSILKKIETESIKPHSKFYFYLKNISFWGLFASAIVAGAISFAIILYASFNTDFAVGDFVEKNEILTQWLTLLPLVWVLLIGVAIGIGMVGLKHTKRGYRIALATLVASNIAGSIVLGSGLYAAGGAQVIEEALEENVSFYESTREKHQKFWGNPEDKGRLAGRVMEINQEKQTILLEGPYGNTWEVPYGEKTMINNPPEVGKMLKIKGAMDGERRFRPEKMGPADKQEVMHQRIERHLDRYPELREKFEESLSAETKAEIDALKETGERPSPEFRDKIRLEIDQNTTEEERAAFREDVLNSINDKLEEDGLSPRLQRIQRPTAPRLAE